MQTEWKGNSAKQALTTCGYYYEIHGWLWYGRMDKLFYPVATIRFCKWYDVIFR